MDQTPEPTYKKIFNHHMKKCTVAILGPRITDWHLSCWKMPTSMLLTGGYGHGSFRFLSVVPFDDRLRSSDPLGRCGDQRGQRVPRVPPLQYREDRRRRLPADDGSGRVLARRARHHRPGEHAPRDGQVTEGGRERQRLL